MGIKQTLFANLEAAAPGTCILATNTSSLPVSAIGANLKDRARFGGLHFFNPVPMMRLLEVIKEVVKNRLRFFHPLGLGVHLKG